VRRFRPSFRQGLGVLGFVLVFLAVVAVGVWRGDIVMAGLDPKVPFQTYTPPPAPDYGRASAWALLDSRGPDSGPAAVFFVHSTTFDGGREWNAPIGDRKADAYLNRAVLPNYAGPFRRVGSVSAPRYRQASLYTRLTLREDAREARAFAYRDVAAAFDAWLARHPEGPIVLAGVEQGGDLVVRLARDRIAGDPALRGRLVAAYAMDTIVPVERPAPSLPPCARRDQTGCLVVWSAVDESNDGAARRRLKRALVWDARGHLVELNGAPAVCVNPVTGSTDGAAVDARRSQGATNATGLEWGARPALITREIATQCRDGLLRHTAPRSESFHATGSWSDRRKSQQYNLFYGDIEADVQTRLMAWQASAAA
jgi:hypothetical protein